MVLVSGEQGWVAQRGGRQERKSDVASGQTMSLWTSRRYDDDFVFIILPLINEFEPVLMWCRGKQTTWIVIRRSSTNNRLDRAGWLNKRYNDLDGTICWPQLSIPAISNLDCGGGERQRKEIVQIWPNRLSVSEAFDDRAQTEQSSHVVSFLQGDWRVSNYRIDLHSTNSLLIGR